MRMGHVKASVLGIWAVFFSWLLVSGDIFRYIGPRTYWVVIFGAVSMTLATAGYVSLVMSSEDSPVTARGLLRCLGVIVPILLVVAIPDPSLGSLSVSRRSSGAPVAVAALAPTNPERGGEISFQEVSYASGSSEYAAALGLSEGYPVRFVGFVSDAATGVVGTVALSRFSIFCCAADAVPYMIPVVPPAGSPPYAVDTWIDVEGSLERAGDRWVLEARRIEEVDAPENPYL